MTDIPNRGQKPPVGFERQEYAVAGKPAVVYTGGAGRPVVFWHGGGTFHGIDFARPWLDKCRVIAPHHPGFGDAHADPGYADMTDYVLHYLELFEQMGLKEFDLIGISLGGWMAAEFAAQHREKIRRLVLCAPAGLVDPDHPATPLETIPGDELLSYLAHDPAVFTPYLPQTEAEQEAFNALLAGEGETLSKLLPADGPFRPGLESWIHRLTMPTLLLWGREDRVLPVGKTEKWRRLLPDPTVKIIDGAGHTLLDESAEAREAVADFLA